MLIEFTFSFFGQAPVLDNILTLEPHEVIRLLEERITHTLSAVPIFFFFFQVINKDTNSLENNQTSSGHEEDQPTWRQIKLSKSDM